MEIETTRLTKKDIVDRLKEFKKKRINISIPLNSPAIDLLNELQSLIKLSATPAVHVEDGPFSLILLKLSINTIFRLYQYSSQVRRIVDAPRGLFWRKLIERDLGVVPLFKVDLKLHYLRILNVPIAGTKYVPIKRYHGTFKQEHEGVVAMSVTATDVVVNASGKVHHKKLKIYERRKGERIIRLESLYNDLGHVLITDHDFKIIKGQSLIDFDNISGFKELKLIRLVQGWNKFSAMALTKNGEVYYIGRFNMFKLILPEPIIDCEFINFSDIIFLSNKGIIYE